jgi:hypothetical protein
VSECREGHIYGKVYLLDTSVIERISEVRETQGSWEVPKRSWNVKKKNR